MTSADKQQARRGWPMAVLLIAVGLGFAWATLTAVGWRQQSVWPAAGSPFGYPRVLAVHLLLALPLCLWTGRLWTTRLTDRPRLAIGLLVLSGSGVCLISWTLAPSIRQWGADASPVFRHFLRLIWAWLLLAPWSAASVLAYRQASGFLSESPYRLSKRLFWVDGVIALLLGLLPILHVQQVIERRTALFHDAIVNQRYVEALEIAERLHDLGVDQIGEVSSADIVARLDDRIEQLRQRVAQPLPASATAEQRLQRASQLYGLGRYDEVRRVLQPLPPDPRVDLRLAVTDEAQRDYQSAAAGYQRTIDALAHRETLSEDQLRLLRIAFERRANNLRRIGDGRQAEQELLDALERWPQVRGAILLQLGFHYQMAGRTVEAVDFFEQAARENPQYREQANAAIARWQQQAEGCLLRTTRGATR